MKEVEPPPDSNKPRFSSFEEPAVWAVLIELSL